MLRIFSVLIYYLFLSNPLVECKELCYTGSNLYQLGIKDCGAQDPGYNGTWYCAKMEICESYISSKRICVTTRGCATESECTSNSGSIYSGSAVQVNGKSPAGMKIQTTCCPAHSYPDDDTVQLDYQYICNNATSIFYNPISMIIIMFTCMIIINYIIV